jgi:hypothetical protein
VRVVPLSKKGGDCGQHSSIARCRGARLILNAKSPILKERPRTDGAGGQNEADTSLYARNRFAVA